MKFNHSFKLIDNSDSFRKYASENINAQIDFISDNAIRVAIFKSDEYMLPTFNICPDNKIIPPCGRDRLSTQGFCAVAPQVCATENSEKIALQNGVEISIDLNNFLITYTKNGNVLFNDRGPLAYNFEGEFGNGCYHYISRQEDEKIYGLGDKGGKLNKAGKAYRIETTDCMGYDASETDPLYKHIPFYICENANGCYGLFYDTSDTSYFDFGKEINNYYEPYKYFKTNDNCLVYYVLFGTKLEILKQFSRLTGKQMLPPKWSFDYCASTMAYTDAPRSEEKMNDFLSKVKSLGMSCGGFYLSSGYTSIGNQRYVFNWNYDKFPNPKEFISNFSKNGIEIIPNIKPAFLNDHPMYEMIKKNGWFVKDKNGEPFITQFWDGYGSYLDFTNPDAYAFWSEQVKTALLDNGIIATWNDNNEFDIKDEDSVANGFGNGKVNASRIRSVLTYLMVNSSYDAQMAKNPKLRPFLSTRSGNIGTRRFAQTWSGDNRTNFKDLRYCHYIGLTMSLSGLYFYGHDLGGFHGDMPSRELLLRWIQHGIFEPRLTIHSWNADGSATMPWSYPDIIDSVKGIFAQRKQLEPYLYNCAYRAVEYDEPINAPLFLYYDDEISEDCQSFMVGRDILATCVFDEGEEKVNAYLPKNECWYYNGKCYDGGCTVELSIPATSKMPYFVRGGSVVATNEAEYGYNCGEKLQLTIYPIKNGSFKAEFFNDDGVSFEYQNGNCVMLDINVDCNDDSVIVTYKNKGKMEFEPCFKLYDADSRKLIIK